MAANKLKGRLRFRRRRKKSNSVKSNTAISACAIEQGECFRKIGGKYVYLRISESSVNFYKLDPNLVYGVCFTGNITAVDSKKLVEPCLLTDVIKNRKDEDKWHEEVGCKNYKKIDGTIGNKDDNRPRVLVSGCFDALHPGHICFLEVASTYGDLYVSVGNDEAIKSLKNRTPLFDEDERLYMIKNLKMVKDAGLGKGTSIIDFTEMMDNIKPDIFIVNSDGDSEEKRKYVEEKGVKYIVLNRVHKNGLKPHSTTEIIKQRSEEPLL